MSDDSKTSTKTSIFRQESLERLSSPEQLDQLMQVVNSRSWLPLATLAALVVLALLWSIFGRIPITATGQGVLVRSSNTSDELVGLTFFGRGEGDRIQPGMQIIIVPNTASSDRVGGIIGEVKQVLPPSITTLDEARQTMLSDPATLYEEAIEVIAELERDPSNPSGYKWSSLGGDSLSLAPGITTTARITLEERAPIRFIFPFF